MRQVLFLHGFTGSPESWESVRHHMKNPYRAIAPHLCGHGRPYPRVAAHQDSFAQEVTRLAEACQRDAEFRGADVRIVCGYSLGARLALALIVAHPDLFSSAVLIGVHPGLSHATEREIRKRNDQELAAMLRSAGLSHFLAYWQDLPLFASQRRLPQGAVEAQRRIREQHSAAGLAHSLETCGLGVMPDYSAQLERVELPVHLLVGGDDVKFSDLGRRLCSLLPQCRLDSVPNCGHNLLLEAPAAVAALLDRNLS